MIGKTIKSILTTNNALIALVPASNIYPYVANSGTSLPVIVYTIDSIEPQYTKGGWVNDLVNFSVHSFSRDYNNLQSIVSAVRNALELNESGYGTQNINKIYLGTLDEGYDNAGDIFYNTLTFSVRINTY